MADDRKMTISCGGGCLNVVGIVFIVLKLLGVEPVASWSWIWVLCPFWIVIAIGALTLFLALLAICFAKTRRW